MMSPLPVESEMPDQPAATTGTPLADAALGAIRRAAVGEGGELEPARARNIWQPDTWLIRRCWETLADAGEAEAALAVARRAAERHALAPMQALLRMSNQVPAVPALATRLARELQAHQAAFSTPHPTLSVTQQSEQLLLAAATAARIDAPDLAFGSMERLDQIKGGWDAIFAAPELRILLAETTARLGLHPLTAALIRSSIRRFGEAGAHYLAQITDVLAPQLTGERPPPQSTRLLARCLETVRYATLITLHSHRVATTILARAGLADEVLAHLVTIGRVQEARRESGLALRKNEQSLLRQVKRPQADPDVDFLVYTLQDAIRAMPVRQITREQRIELSEQLATLGTRSDGWTAAGAATTLIDLGALKFATNVVDNIALDDPTRSEGAVALVDGLLTLGQKAEADEAADKALQWARSFEGANALRATLWGLVEVYLEQGEPQRALDLLAGRTQQAGVITRLRGLFQKQWRDDDLRDNRLRLAAYLAQNAHGANVEPLVCELREWAPQLLEGEALISFMLDGMIEPLFTAGRSDLAMALLPEVTEMLGVGGSKHAAHVMRLATLLAQGMATGELDGHDLQAARTFLETLWRSDAERGLWQSVYGVDGSLPLLLQLEGTRALIHLANAAAAEGEEWSIPEEAVVTKSSSTRAPVGYR
jgi:hypothetical protein